MQTIHDTEEPATMSHDSSQPRVPSLFNDKGSLTLNELMVLCTTLSKKVEDLQNDLKQTKLTYGVAYTKLIMRVKKLKHKGRTSADTKVLLEQEEPTELVEDPGSGEKGEKEISTAEVLVSTASVILEVSTTTPKRQAYIRRSAEKRKDKGKAIMKDDESVQKKTKKQVVKSGCTTAVDVVPWETDEESMAIDTNVTTPVNVIGASVTNTVANHAKKPEKFNGQNFKRWQQKMFFYLTTLNLARFLKETAPQTTTAKELWESLERKYKTEDTSTKKFVVARFLDYKMVDSKNVITQVQDLQILIHKIHAEGMTVCETFQVAAIIEKGQQAGLEKHYAPDSAKANMVEHAGSSSKSNSKAKGKGKKKNDKKPGHRAANCKMPKRVNPRQANIVNDNMDMVAMVSDVIATVSEVNLVGSNNSGCWVDTGATRHVCVDKSMFHSFKAVDNGEKLYMGNSATADI
ncbi:hypothetical protein Tco_0087699 [Tanacetum coccineum]